MKHPAHSPVCLLMLQFMAQVPMTSINLAGRPRGTKQYSFCILSIFNEYSHEFTKRKAAGTCAPPLLLDKLIEREKSEFKISTIIPKGRVQSWRLWGNFKSNHLGAKSPIEEAKKDIVELCIQMGTIHQPLTVNKGIELMNSLIAKTDLQDNVKISTLQKAWQQKD